MRYVVVVLFVIASATDARSQSQSGENSAESIPVSREYVRVFAPGGAPAPSEPIRLEPGPHVLLDDYLFETSENVRRVMGCPDRDPAIPNPVVTGKEDGCFQPYMTVLRDPSSGRFRLWFGHRVEDNNAGSSHLGYLESDDGIHWQRPVRVLADPAPIQFGVSIVDDGPACPNSTQRYKYAWWMDGGMQIAASPDGLTWTPIADGVVLRHNHDIDGIFWDPLRRRYQATISVYRPGDTWESNRRVTMQSHSDDLVHWAKPHYVLLPDASVDAGETQFYAMDGYLVRGDLLIGMVKVLRDDLKADDPPNPPDAYGIGYTTLAWTRDGQTWTRDPAHFFDPDPKKDAWDHAHAWIDEQILVDDRLFLYYGGYAHGHKVNRFEERQIGLLAIPRDRYAGWTADTPAGRIVTRPLHLDGKALALNVDASNGSVRAQFLSEDRKPIPGFTFDDMTPISANALAAPLEWKTPIPQLPDVPVRLEIQMERASLYAIEMVKP